MGDSRWPNARGRTLRTHHSPFFVAKNQVTIDKSQSWVKETDQVVKVRAGFVWSIIWLLVLIFIAFWIAGLCAGLYIFLQPFSVCLEALNPVQEILLKAIQFPKTCAENMMAGKAGI